MTRGNLDLDLFIIIKESSNWLNQTQSTKLPILCVCTNQIFDYSKLTFKVGDHCEFHYSSIIVGWGLSTQLDKKKCSTLFTEIIKNIDNLYFHIN